jgi:putative ABC transport system permease protein
MKARFWLRWAWRDLRRRWLQVAAIALIIALGTGIYAGLGGQETWRLTSLERSNEILQFHDLRVGLTTGSFVDTDAVVASVAEVDGIARVEPRLVLDTLVDASTADQTILVAGRIVGVDPAQGGPLVDRIYYDQGRALTEADGDVAVLETKFTRYYGLEPGAKLALIGGTELDVVGIGLSPEYYQILPDQVGFTMQGEANLAVIYTPLSTAQAIYSREGLVNDLRIQLADGADRAAVQAAVEDQLSRDFPSIGFGVTAGEDDPVYSLLYHDAIEDQEMLDLIAYFFLFGAALAAFNLAGRIVESQRRQIGIGMALGVPRRWLAVRPLLVGLQIALIGTVLGLLLGLAFTYGFGMVMAAFIPMPYFPAIMLHAPSFLLAALLGITLPLLATLIPVYQAVRTEPLEAIHGHLSAKSSGLNRWLKRVSLPGNTFSQMPLNNVLRSPKRTLLTVFGVAVAIALLFIFLGLLDTMLGTFDQLRHALLYRSPDRHVVTLDTFYPADHEQVRGLAMLTTETGQPLFEIIEPGLRLSGQLINGEEEMMSLLEFYQVDSAIWTPALLNGQLHGAIDEPGMVIARKAADDLGVEVGDTLLLEHPFREGPFAFRTATTAMTVAGIHDNPVRGFSYVALDNARITGLEGLTNVLVVTPAQGVTLAQIRRVLFAYPGIVAVDMVAEMAEGFDDLMALILQVLRIMQGAVLFIAFLIAFNSTSINIDDRLREVATMFAFGVRPRTVMWMQIGENVLLGLLGTVIGGLLGWVMLNQMMVARMEVMLEDINLLITIAPLSLILAVVLGVGAVALTPLLSVLKLRRIDIPSTLRVME